jgi:hypothetical protein
MKDVEVQALIPLAYLLGGIIIGVGIRSKSQRNRTISAVFLLAAVAFSVLVLVGLYFAGV